MSDYILQVKDLKKSFKSTVALDGIDFSIQQGHCFGLLGPNGAGKTTCIEIIEGLVTADSGEIVFQGQQKSPKHNAQIGVAFQSTALPDNLNVSETLHLFAGMYPNNADLQVLIEQCQLSPILNNNVKQLSGGQRQRLLLALALVNDPCLIFLDEPTTGLDPKARRDFWHLIQTIKQMGKTIVLTTHYMEEAQFLCDEIAIINAGKIICQQAPEVLLRQHFKQVTLQLPLTLSHPALQSWQQQAGMYQLEVDNLDKALRALLQHDLDLSQLQLHQPNLEDLFLKLTGQSLADEHV